MLDDGSRPSRLRRNTLHFRPAVARITGFINATAGRRDYVVRIAGIDINRKDVRVVNDSVLDILPGLPAISRLVRQVPGARVDGVGRSGVNGERFDVHESGRGVSGQLCPRIAGDIRTKNSVEGPGDQHTRVGVELRQEVQSLNLELRTLV